MTLEGEVWEPCPLTPREYEVIELFSKGLSIKAIAECLGRSFSTVGTQLHTARKKLGVTSTAQAVLLCYRKGWFDPFPPPPPPPHPYPNDEDIRITQSQRRYLAAFDITLLAKSEEHQRLGRELMIQMLKPVLRERTMNETKESTNGLA